MQPWQTLIVPCSGGLIQNQDRFTLANQFPGAATFLQNIEPSIEGGYRRISGYTTLSDEVVPDYYDNAGTPTINGGTATNPSGVTIWNDLIIASRYDYIYSIDPTNPAGTWTRINAASPLNNPSRVRYIVFRLGTERFVALRSTGKPIMYDGTTVTVLSGAGYNHIVGDYYKGRLFCSNGSDVVEYSSPNDPTDWTGASGGGEIKIGDQIVAIKVFRDSVYVFGRDSIHKITSNADNTSFELEEVTTKIGCLNADTIQEVGGILYFLAPDGIRPIAATDRIGDTEIETVSKPVTPMIRSYIEEVVSSLNPCSVVIRGKSQYRIMTALPDDPANSRGIIGGIRQNADGGMGWEWGNLRGIQARVATSGYIGGEEYVIHLCLSAYVYRQETGNSFNGRDIEGVFRTPHHNMGDSTVRKTVNELSIFGRVEGSRTISVKVILEGGDPNIVQPDSFDITISTPAARYGTALYGTDLYGYRVTERLDDYLDGSGFTIALEFTSNDTDPAWLIKHYEVQWNLNGRY